MKSTSLYNLDGSLSPEAQQLLSHRPDGVSIADWRKTLKKFRDQLSPEDLKEFERLRNNKRYAKRRDTKRKRKEQQITEPLAKVSLYEQDRVLRTEAQQLLSHRPDGVSIADWRKMLKDFRSQLSSEDCKEFQRLRKNKRDAKRRAENPEKIRTENAKWRAENPEKVAKWYAENPEKAKETNAKWRAANLDHTNNYHKQRRATDPLFHLQCNIRSNCRRVVKQLSLGKKPVSTFKWIGCSPEELKAHLEFLFTEGMSWENYGEWHVDHIRPVCSFTAEEWEQVNHYTNLRPLWAEDNLAKIVFDKRQRVKKETPTQEESLPDVTNLR